MTTPMAREHPAEFRLEPSPRLGVGLAVGYLVVLVSARLVTGVAYDDLFDSAGNAWRGAVLPLAVAGALVVAFTLWTRWDMVWHDPGRLPMRQALRVVALVFAAGGLLRLAGVDWPGVPGGLLVAAVVAAALLGLTEELVFRGLVLRCLRTHGRTEGVAALVACLLYGVFHVGNLLEGADPATVLFQVILTTLVGMGFYLFRRWSGRLSVAMAVNALWSLGVVLTGDYGQDNAAFGGALGFLALVVVPVACLAATFLVSGQGEELVVDRTGPHSEEPPR